MQSNNYLLKVLRQGMVALFLLCFCVPLNAKRVEVKSAAAVAQFLTDQRFDVGDVKGDKLVLAYTAQNQKLPGSPVIYYVFNVGHGDGFIIISGDDIARPVVGYSTQGSYDHNNRPTNFEAWMEDVYAVISQGIADGISGDALIQEEWEAYLRRDTEYLPAGGTRAVNQLLSTTWDQTSPYWNQCPSYGGNQCVTGCVATAMSQLMKYHNYPAQGTGSSPAYTTTTLGINIPSINFNVNYNFNDMGDATPTTPTAIANVAQLMYHAGASVYMDYGTSSIGSAAYDDDAAIALTTYFKYDKGLLYERKTITVSGTTYTYYTDNQWIAMLQQELDANRPVYYAGSGPAGGHAFICDGYNEQNQFHFNWGWGGSSNGYYTINLLNPSGYTFPNSHAILRNMKPDPAGTSTQSYQMYLLENTNLTATATSVMPGQAFNAETHGYRNLGYTTFPGGYYGIGLFNPAGDLVEVISAPLINVPNQIAPGAGFGNTLTFDCSVSSSVTSGNYTMKAIVSATYPNPNWVVAKGTLVDELPLQVIAPTYTLTPSAGANGTISPNTPVTVTQGGSQTFTFTPATNYEVDDVKVDNVSVGFSGNQYTFTNVTANHTINVTFKLKQYTLTPTAGANGTISPNTPVTVNHGGSQTFTFTPAANYEVDEVKVDDVSVSFSGNQYTFTNVTADHTIHVTFKQYEYGEYIIHSTCGSGGTISPGGDVLVVKGDDKTFLITPKQGYKISQVWVDDMAEPQAVIDGYYTFTNVQAEHWLMATFTYISIEQYYINASVSSVGGTISPAGKVLVESGEDYTFTFTAQAGYQLKEVLVNGINNLAAVAAEEYTFYDITSSHTIVGKFEKRNYLITASNGTAGGTVSPIGESSVTYGGSKAYTITAQTGYIIDEVKIDGTNNPTTVSSGKYTFSNVTDNHTIVATFKNRTYDITATAGINGIISPDGVSAVIQGNSITYNIVPDANYVIKTVLVDGKNNAAAVSSGSYTFTNVTAKHTIAATFAEPKDAKAEYNAEKYEIAIYPNPTSGLLNITYYRHCGLDPQSLENDEIAGDPETSSARNDIQNVAIFDVMGRAVVVAPVETRHATSLQSQITFDLSNVPTGVYFLRIKTESGVVVRKVVKSEL